MNARIVLCHFFLPNRKLEPIRGTPAHRRGSRTVDACLLPMSQAGGDMQHGLEAGDQLGAQVLATAATQTTLDAESSRKRQPPQYKQRPAGTGRKARRRRREKECAAGGTLMRAPMLHGNTAPGRLRLLDGFCMAYRVPLFRSTKPSMIQKNMPVVVDVGVGDEATTTVEMLDRLIPGCTVVGTEVEEWRLQALEKSTLPSQVQLRRGSTDFELPVRGGEAVHVIRAMNVLRDYHPQDALKALHTLSGQLEEGGLLLEGACNTAGTQMVVLLVRHTPSGAISPAGSELEGVLFAADLSSTALLEEGAPPEWFQRYLPRIWQHQAPSGTSDVQNTDSPIHCLLEAWSSAASETMPAEKLCGGRDARHQLSNSPPFGRSTIPLSTSANARSTLDYQAERRDDGNGVSPLIATTVIPAHSAEGVPIKHTSAQLVQQETQNMRGMPSDYNHRWFVASVKGLAQRVRGVEMTVMENVPKLNYVGAMLDVIYDFDREESEVALSEADLIKFTDAFAARPAAITRNRL
ncbi:hypothetical protein CYMTET_18751 [Cymbomonas tetramitiformis]|uniref:Uncharacterized protein n=1 Tax=Cymbomonas tetramitiformis TaxID=36881 RepID=A0AAE0G7Z2_9CHLO|nr:hypothetical protein CYMTET_18751 [Cymbomonas tetramitiformis]